MHMLRTQRQAFEDPEKGSTFLEALARRVTVEAEAPAEGGAGRGGRGLAGRLVDPTLPLRSRCQGLRALQALATWRSSGEP